MQSIVNILLRRLKNFSIISELISYVPYVSRLSTTSTRNLMRKASLVKLDHRSGRDQFVEKSVLIAHITKLNVTALRTCQFGNCSTYCTIPQRIFLFNFLHNACVAKTPVKIAQEILIFLIIFLPQKSK